MAEKTDARQRIADAMKPKRRAPEPVDPEDEGLREAESFLAGGADPADAPDETATWALDPVTRAKTRELKGVYVARAKQLFAQAIASTDPKVAVLGGQVNALALAITKLGGKV